MECAQSKKSYPRPEERYSSLQHARIEGAFRSTASWAVTKQNLLSVETMYELRAERGDVKNVGKIRKQTTSFKNTAVHSMRNKMTFAKLV